LKLNNWEDEIRQKMLKERSFRKLKRENLVLR